jgi:hypothetical protein
MATLIVHKGRANLPAQLGQHHTKKNSMLRLQRTEDSFKYRDLNNNGQLDAYEDAPLPLEARVTDLPSRMTVAEKAGLTLQTFAAFVRDGSASLPDGEIGQSAPGKIVLDQRMSNFNFPEVTDPRMAAE